MQKYIYSRWIENSKGQSRQKLGIQKKKKQSKAWLPKHIYEEALWFGLQMATSARLLINGLYPQGLFISPSNDTLCRAWPQCWLDSSPMMLSPRKTVEWLYNYVGPFPILLTQSFLIQLLYSHAVIQIQVSCTYSYILHTYIHTYIIHSYLHAYKHSYIQHANQIIHTW
jgi:hypothetical protein